MDPIEFDISYYKLKNLLCDSTMRLTCQVSHSQVVAVRVFTENG